MMKNPLSKKNCIVIVDAFSTGRLLAEKWSRYALLLHVQSSAHRPEAFVNSLPHEIFYDQFVFNGNWPLLWQWLDQYAIDEVVCGSEFGVLLTDVIAAELGLKGNPPELSSARRDKFQMSRALERNGVNSAHCHEANSVDQAIGHYKKLSLNKVVVKPLDSAGSEDVYICESSEAVSFATQATLGKVNLMQSDNRSVLVQEFLEGDEYIVNSVSAEGQHFITDVWKSCKVRESGGRIIYSHEILQDANQKATTVISDYIYQVLDALQILWGPAHSELILTERGPILLETGARLSGLANPPALSLATGHNQVSLSVDAYRGPESLLKLAGKPYHKTHSAYCINLIAPYDAKIDKENFERNLTELKSFHSLSYRRSSGLFSRTVDLNSSPGVVFLVHENEDQVVSDYQKLRSMEEVIYRPI